MNLSPQFKQQFRTGLRRGTMGLTAVALTAGIGVSNMTHEAPVGGWYGDKGSSTITAMSKPRNEPTWNAKLSQQFQGYQDMSERPKTTIPSGVVGVDQRNRAREYSLDEAHARNQDKSRHNDLWVVGGKW